MNLAALLAALSGQKGQPVYQNPEPQMPSGNPMNPYMAGLMSDENQAQGRADQLEREAYSEEIPQRRGMRPGNIGLAGIAAIIAQLAGDKEQTFMKGALSTIEQQESQRLEQQMQNLQRKSQEKIMMARQEAAKADRARQAQTQAMMQQLKIQEMEAEKARFKQQDETERYKADKTFDRGMGVAEINNAAKIKVAEIKGLMTGMSSAQKADFIEKNGGDPNVAEAFRQLTPKEQMDIARARNLNAKTRTEDELRADRKRQLQAQTAVFLSIPGVNRAKAENLAMATSLMDDKEARLWALAEASIENLKAKTANMPAETAIKWAQANARTLAEETKIVNAGLASVDKNLGTLRNERGRLEAELNEAILDKADPEQIKHLRNAINEIDKSTLALNKRRTQVMQDAARLQSRLQSGPGGGVTPGSAMNGARQRLMEQYQDAIRQGAPPDKAKAILDREMAKLPKTEAGGPKAQRMTELGQQFTGMFRGARVEQFGPGSIPNSTHKTGEGLDLRGPDLQAYANWAMKIPGINNVIYNRRIWSPGKGWRNYVGPHPHNDHVHID